MKVTAQTLSTTLCAASASVESTPISRVETKNRPVSNR